jgi:hypothetical protein
MHNASKHRLGSVLGALCCFSGVAISAPLAPGPANTACTYAARVLATLPSDVVLDDRLINPPATPSASDNVVKAWRSRGATNLFTACPELRAKIPEGVRFASQADYVDVAKIPPTRTLTIVGFAAPFVSADGKQMITAWIRHCPGLCGGYAVERRRRTATGWSEPEFITAAMS